MAFSDLGSAIDDSFDPTFFPPAPGSAGGDDERSYYDGPRSGHWTVTSTIGSAIDDRCPTIWGANAGPNTLQQPGAVKPIPGGLLRKLAKASLEKKAAEAEVEDHGDGSGDSEQNKIHQDLTHSTPYTTPKQAAKPKGFYLPRADDMRSIKITAKEGNDKVVRAPRVRPEIEKKKAKEDAKRAQAPSPQPSVASEKAPSAASQASLPMPKKIRIRGKDGREAFVELPSLPRPSSRFPSAAAGKNMPKEVSKGNKRPVKEANVEKTKEEPYEEDKTAAAKMAAKIMMSGALPASQRTPKQGSPARQLPVRTQKTPVGSSKSSTKDSGVGFGDLFETAASAHSSRAVSVKSLQAAVQSISKNSNSSKPTSHRSYQQNRSISPLSAASVASSKPNTPEHSFHGAAGFQDDMGAVNWVGDVASQERPTSEARTRSGSHQSTKPGDERSPTVFAGRGWISPHPLSRSPSAVRSPPQSHISLPRDDDFFGGATVTYQDWKAMQEKDSEVRRNFSKTESVVSSRVKAVAASIARSGSQASARPSAAGSQMYKQATVESEHGSQHRSVKSASNQGSQHQSVKSASNHGSQRTAHWSQADDKSQAGNGWDALPQFDGASQARYTPSQQHAALYEQRLQDIIAQHPSQSAHYGQAAGWTGPRRQEIQLDMPWDKNGPVSPMVAPTPAASSRFQEVERAELGYGGKW